MTSIVNSDNFFTLIRASGKIGDPITFLALDYLDSLVNISLTCKYLSSRHSEFWKGFCYRFRVTPLLIKSDYFFYAEHILLRKSKISAEEISQIPLLESVYKYLWYPYPIEFIVRIVDRVSFVLPEDILETLVSVANTKTYCRHGIMLKDARPMNEIIRRIGTLFAIFLERGANIRQQTISNIVKLMNGFKVIKIVQQLLQRRNLKIPSAFVIKAIEECSTQKLRDYCLRYSFLK